MGHCTTALLGMSTPYEVGFLPHKFKCDEGIPSHTHKASVVTLLVHNAITQQSWTHSSWDEALTHPVGPQRPSTVREAVLPES